MGPAVVVQVGPAVVVQVGPETDASAGLDVGPFAWRPKRIFHTFQQDP